MANVRPQPLRKSQPLPSKSLPHQFIQVAVHWFQHIVERHKVLARWTDGESTDIPGFTPKHSHEDNVNLPKLVETFKEWKE